MDNPQHSLDEVALNALAHRCEAAMGPDRELDIDICTRGLNKSRSDPGFQSAPFYTASLDAAMTLKPEGLTFLLSSVNPDEELDDGRIWALVGDPECNFDACGAATPALALCAASLRAKARGSNDTQL